MDSFGVMLGKVKVKSGWKKTYSSSTGGNLHVYVVICKKRSENFFPFSNPAKTKECSRLGLLILSVVKDKLSFLGFAFSFPICYEPGQ